MARWWVKLYADINSDPRFLSVELEEQAVYLRLLPMLDDNGVFRCVPSRTLAESVAAAVHRTAECVEPLLAELARVQLVWLYEDRLHMPKFAKRQGRAASSAAAGPAAVGPQGGKTSTERSRESRERRRLGDGRQLPLGPAPGIRRLGDGQGAAAAAPAAVGPHQAAPPGAPVAGGATGDATDATVVAATGDATGRATGDATGATDNATGRMATEHESVRAVESRATGDATGATGLRIEKNRIDVVGGAPATGATASAAVATMTPAQRAQDALGRASRGAIDPALSPDGMRALAAFLEHMAPQGYGVADFATLGEFASGGELARVWSGKTSLRVMLGRANGSGGRDGGGLLKALGLARDWKRAKDTRAAAPAPAEDEIDRLARERRRDPEAAKARIRAIVVPQAARAAIEARATRPHRAGSSTPAGELPDPATLVPESDSDAIK